MSLFQASPSNACAAYSNVRNATSGFALEARKHCEDLWRDYAPLADANFLTDFPIRLHERWFEMYLAVSLIRAGFDVQSRKPGPDILLTYNCRQIWIEATCANPGDVSKPDSVPEVRRAGRAERITATERPTDAMTLRLRNSLDAKQKTFVTYRDNGIVGPDDLTVVAINVHAIPNAWADMDDLMRRSLYGLGDLILTIDRDRRETVDHFYQEREEINKKGSGNTVNVRPFIDGSVPHISAILGSREDVANRPLRLGDGFTIYPNLTATHQWEAGIIQRGQEWIVEERSDDGWKLTQQSYIA